MKEVCCRDRPWVLHGWIVLEVLCEETKGYRHATVSYGPNWFSAWKNLIYTRLDYKTVQRIVYVYIYNIPSPDIPSEKKKIIQTWKIVNIHRYSLKLCEYSLIFYVPWTKSTIATDPVFNRKHIYKQMAKLPLQFAIGSYSLKRTGVIVIRQEAGQQKETPIPSPILWVLC